MIIAKDNELPRGIKDRAPQGLRNKPRFLHLLLKEKAGLVAGYSHPAQAGYGNRIGHTDCRNPEYFSGFCFVVVSFKGGKNAGGSFQRRR
jgi:hypothetical protein